MKILRPFLFPLFSFLCLSCAVPPARPPAAELEALWTAHAAGLAPLTAWSLRGRLAVRTDDHGGQATLSWERAAVRDSIRLDGPFGQGVVRVTQDADGAQLLDAEAREYRAATAGELLYRYTGWELPIDELGWWVRGLPAPGAASTRVLDEAGRLRSLSQQGWRVQYERYLRVGAVELPGRLTLVRAADSSRPGMEVRFVIERWAQVR